MTNEFFFLKLAHDATILFEGLIAFGRLNHQSKDKAQIANARAKIAEKLLHIVEEQEKKY